MKSWLELVQPMRREAMYGDRVVPCYPARPKGVAEIFDTAIKAHPQREAIVCDAVRLTWQEVGQRVGDLAGWLAAQGVKRGDRVALLLGNDWPIIVALFSIARLGAIAVPVTTKSSRAELQYILEDSAATALLYDSAFESLAAVGAAALRICAPISTVLADQRFARSIAPANHGDEQDPAMIIYTSGTTGRPKGAIITNIGIVHSAMNYAGCMRLDFNDRFLVAVPMSNITGIVAMVMTCTLAAGALVIMPEFKAAKALTLIVEERVTHTLMVPAMYNLCALLPDFGSYDISAWRIGAYGASPMPSTTIEALAATAPSLQLMNVYGATETTSPSSILPSAFSRSRSNSVGLPVPGCEIIVMDAEGFEVEPGIVGELWISGPMVAKGYWNNPFATDKEFVGGFWKSGDLGSIDKDGFVYVHDRNKDMINRGGYKIFSAEIEAEIQAHPSVLEAAVIGRECPVLGERVHAVVTLRSDRPKATEEELHAFVSKAVADYKRPESWSISYAPLPRNANGKVLKAQLRKDLTPVPLKVR